MLTDEQAQERYLADVRFAIHTSKRGTWRAFERLTGEDIGDYPSESEARAAIKQIDPTAMVRINYTQIVGGPMVADLRGMELGQARDFLRLHPVHGDARPDDDTARAVLTAAIAAIRDACNCDGAIDAPHCCFGHERPAAPRDMRTRIEMLEDMVKDTDA